MIREHAHGVDLRLSHRFDAGWWVRRADTSQTIGVITRERAGWSWTPWPQLHTSSARSRRLACEELVAWWQSQDQARVG